MQFKRSIPPSHVDRPVVCELERSEVLEVLTSYIKQKTQNNQLVLDQVEVVGSPDGQLESMTITGVEVVPLVWTPDQPLGPSIATPKSS